ncbi:MAG TPA: hypothetical protein VEF72_24765 [Mycobacterium sp.]|nr:hypothetical protein [Mycobacterium sp.]
MDVSARSFFMSGVAAVGATAIALAPAVTPPVVEIPDSAAVHLSAAVEPLIPDLLDSALVSIPQLPSAVADAAIFAPAAIADPTIGGAIESLYLAVEPWVAYVFDLAAYVVGFVPYVGVLAPQITFVYDLVESIVRSFLCVYGCEYNFIDFLNGTVSFGGALSIVATAIADAFSTFIHTEINWLLGFLPPLPPLPPLPDVAAAAADNAPVEMATALQEPVGGLLDAHGALIPALVEPLTAAPNIVAASDGVAALDPLAALDPGAVLDPGPLSDLGAVFDAGALSGALSDVSALFGLGLDLGGVLLSLVP